MKLQGNIYQLKGRVVIKAITTPTTCVTEMTPKYWNFYKDKYGRNLS